MNTQSNIATAVLAGFELVSGGMPEHYEVLDLEAAKKQSYFVVDGDLPNLLLKAFEKASQAYLNRDMSEATFGRVGEAAMVELETRSQTLQWVLEMMNVPGKSTDYPVGGYPQGTIFAVTFKTVEAGAAQVFRLTAKDPGDAIRMLKSNYPVALDKMIGIYVDKRSLQPTNIVA